MHQSEEVRPAPVQPPPPTPFQRLAHLLATTPRPRLGEQVAASFADSQVDCSSDKGDLFRCLAGYVLGGTRVRRVAAHCNTGNHIGLRHTASEREASGSRSVAKIREETLYDVVLAVAWSPSLGKGMNSTPRLGPRDVAGQLQAPRRP